jgi:flagellar biosynthetic protein FliO
MSATPDMIATAFKMFAALGIVLGGLVFVFYLTRRVSKIELSGSRQKLIKVIANKYIGVKKNICVVAVADAVLVLGVTNDRISLLTRIEDTEIIQKLNQDSKTPSLPTFSDYLDRMTAKFKAHKSG